MKQTSVKKTVFIGMLGAVSAVLMLLNLSLPFAPEFLKFDISELPALFAGFFLGPLSGCGVVTVKILLKVLFQGSDTGYVGELMNVMGSICFILPASLLYRWKHTRQGAIIAMAVSTVLVSAAFIFINAYIAFPLYSKLYPAAGDLHQHRPRQCFAGAFINERGAFACVKAPLSFGADQIGFIRAARPSGRHFPSQLFSVF